MFVCVFAFGFVGLLPRQLEIACIDLHQTGFVGEGSDLLQLIKILAVLRPPPREGVYNGAKNFGSDLLQPAHSVCVSLSVFFFIIFIYFLYFTL